MRTLLVSLLLIPSAGLSSLGDPFVEELLGKMTLEEKVGQCVQLSSSGEKGQAAAESREAYGVNLPGDAAGWVKRGEVGSLIGCCGIERFNAFQKIAREESRLGIPLLVGHDMIHGVKTQFPIGPALACLWDEATWERCGRLIALETPLKGCNWTFAPMLDMSRDPRWGRIAESPGQDPLIGARMGAALVRGIQSKDVATPVAACLKHYIGYGAAFAGRDYNSVEMSESTLRNVYLPPFRAGVETVQVYTRQIVGVESRPIRELRAWRKVALEPGETKQVTIAVPVAELAYWTRDKLVPAAGPMHAWIARDSVSGRLLTFDL